MSKSRLEVLFDGAVGELVYPPSLVVVLNEDGTPRKRREPNVVQYNMAQMSALAARREKVLRRYEDERTPAIVEAVSAAMAECAPPVEIADLVLRMLRNERDS